MDRKELKKSMDDLKWNIKKASGNLGISERSLHNYLNDKRTIPLYLEKFLKLHQIHRRVVSLLDKA